MSNDPKPDVDKKTAKGKGEGGFNPHPETPAPPEHFDPHSYVTPPDAGDAKAPRKNDQPIPTQESTDTPGAGHERGKGGLPETQPTTKKQ